MTYRTEIHIDPTGSHKVNGIIGLREVRVYNSTPTDYEIEQAECGYYAISYPSVVGKPRLPFGMTPDSEWENPEIKLGRLLVWGFVCCVIGVILWVLFF